MSDEAITREEFKLFAKNTTDCLKQLTQNNTEIKDYMIHNDYRHKDTDKRLTKDEEERDSMKKDISKILRMMREKKGFWKAIENLGKFSKFVVTAILLTLIALSVTGIYNYVVKPDVIVVKTPPKAAP